MYMQRVCAWSVLATVFAASSCGGGGGGSQKTAAVITGRKWVYAVYMAADNNLAQSGIDDLLEMESVGSSPNVTVVVQAEFGGGYIVNDSNQPLAPSTFGLSTYGTSRFEIQKNVAGDGLIHSTQMPIGDRNMASSASLQEFVEWVRAAYPADHTALVIWNHGGAWAGVCQDATSSTGDLLSLPDFKTALDAASAHVDILNFDACLMGTYETAYMVQGHCDYLVASEETEPGAGDPYDSILGQLVGAPLLSPKSLAVAICDRYRDYYIGSNDANVTKSAIDMSRFGMLDAAVAKLAGSLEADLPSELAEIEAARDDSQSFEKAFQRDLAGFAAGLLANCADASVRADAQAVRNLVAAPLIARNVLVDGVRASPNGSGDVSRSTGLAICVPDASEFADQGDNSLAGYQAYSGAASPEWTSFVEALISGELPYDAAPGDFGFLVAWDDPQVDVDLYVEEPSGDWAAPWIGTVSFDGVLSADSSDTGAPVEFYDALPYVEAGDYAVFTNLYDLGSATSAIVTFYYYDGGGWLSPGAVLLDNSNPAPANWWEDANETANVVAGIYSDWYVFGTISR